MHLDDRQLLLKTHAGHEGAARELWARYSPRLLAYARSIVGRGGRGGRGGQGAEDVVQSVFMAVLAEPRRVLKRVNDPAAWMMVLTRRCALNQLRSTRRDADRRRSLASSARTVSSSEVTDDVSRAVGNLPRRLREVVVLRHISGLTFDQVAMALGANRNTAAARYREAMRRLRLMLGEPSDEAAERVVMEGVP